LTGIQSHQLNLVIVETLSAHDACFRVSLAQDRYIKDKLAAAVAMAAVAMAAAMVMEDIHNVDQSVIRQTMLLSIFSRPEVDVDETRIIKAMAVVMFRCWRSSTSNRQTQRKCF
jgi:hypothetical protein